MTINYRAVLLAVFLSLLTFFLVFLGAVSAAPLQPVGTQVCRPGSFAQQDMAGRYESSMMMLEVFPCGGSVVSWRNEYGAHEAVYFSVMRMPSGGLVAYGYAPDPVIGAYLDSVTTIMVKPAEPQWVQVATITDTDQIQRIYRLYKTR